MLIGTFFRFLGGYCIGFWGTNFFKLTYPSYEYEYAIGNFLVKLGGGMPATFIGGYVGDVLESKFLPIKGYVGAFGALFSCIFIVVIYILQKSFWVSIVSLYFAYITAEVWFGPFYAMINKLF